MKEQHGPGGGSPEAKSTDHRRGPERAKRDILGLPYPALQAQ
jgi:hypothetical protein